jgi:hypothetical protein
MGNTFIIASKYGVDVLMNVGADGLRKNGKFNLMYDGQCDSIALVGIDVIFVMEQE